MYIDTHCHLNFGAFSEDWRPVADESVKAGIDKMIVVGADLDTSAKAVEIAAQHDHLFASVGVHPHHAPGEFDLAQLKTLARSNKVIAIGECGLDYHIYQKSKYQETEISTELKNKQKTLFGQQIQLAKELKLPLIIHNREAGNDTLDAINHFSKDNHQYPAGVFHCISGGKKLLKQILALGFYIGVDANITYSQEVQVLTAEAPLDKILLETDSPYLTPDRADARNTPQSVKIVARRLTAIKNVAESEIIKQTSLNAQRLFKF